MSCAIGLDDSRAASATVPEEVVAGPHGPATTCVEEVLPVPEVADEATINDQGKIR